MIKGSKHSKETKRKLSEALKGKRLSMIHRDKVIMNLSWYNGQEGEKNLGWVGDKVCYSALHNWNQKHFKKPCHCEECQTGKAKKFEWANITGKYTRNREDYKYLCASCHDKLDGIVKNFGKYILGA